MHWQLKATIQRAITLLPESAGNRVYYWLQRHAGGLRSVSPVSRMRAAVQTWRHCLTQGLNPAGKTVLEIGTGHVPDAPLAYWLMGASRVITMDINRYLSTELIDLSLAYLAQHRKEMTAIFGSLMVPGRLDVLKDHRDVLRVIEYVAPGDAAATGLPDHSVNVHVSYTVLEHIPESTLGRVLREGDRVLSHDGLFVHCVDYTDHFAHSDSAISHVNFLQYSDTDWHRYAGNRFAYTNRLRHDDFVRLFTAHGRRLVHTETSTHSGVVEALRALALNDRFSAVPQDTLKITGSWLIARPSTWQGC